jgi:putative DNA primase/helicase
MSIGITIDIPADWQPSKIVLNNYTTDESAHICQEYDITDAIGFCEWIMQNGKHAQTFDKGNRHNYIYNLCCLLNEYGVSELDATNYILSAYPHFRENPSNAIQFGYRDTHKFGIRQFKLFEKKKGKTSNSTTANSKKKPQTDLPDAKKTLKLAKQDEKGNAELMSIICKGEYLYNHTANKWMIWALSLWVVDEKWQARKEMITRLQLHLLSVSKGFDNEIIELEKQFTQANSLDTGDYLKQTASVTEEKNRLTTDRDFLRSVMHRFNKRSKMDNLMNLASSHLAAITNDFDKDPYLLNTLNGTYHFKSGKFSDPDPENLLSKQIAVSYVPDAKCEAWVKFLHLVFDNDEKLISFIQRCIGYCLTGLTDIQALLFCHGKGANGKSTFFSILKMLLGDYYCTILIETLLVKQRDATVEYQLAKMKGARIVVASEIPKDRKLHESQVKDLTGGEMINARNPFEKPFSFLPTHKLWLFGNHKPIIKGTDHGIWRRILLIPFSVTIPEEEQRPMSEVLEEMRKELPGILNWAIDGYYDFKKNGLNPPKIVTEETEKYKTESDVLTAFFEERCLIGPSLFCTTKVLYEEYLKWCEEEKETPVFRSSRQIPGALRERGFKVESGNANVTTAYGLTIRPKEKKEATLKS